MFLNFYRLREQPFGVTPNPRFLYHSPVHREALASLIYGIEADLGFTALIAEPGMGKTTLLFYLLEKFRTTARTALIFQTQCTRVELLRYLARELEIPSNDTDPVVLNERVLEILVREARARRRVIVIIDEAQNLSEDALESVRLLSDFETPESKLLHIILAGQPELAEKLARPAMAQLLQRIAMLNRLRPLSVDQIRDYIEYRLGVAGYRGPTLFTTQAISKISDITGGVPRKINRVCFNALSLGCALQKSIIDAEIIAEVGSDLDLGELLYEKGATPLEEPDNEQEESRKSAATATPPGPAGQNQVAARTGPVTPVTKVAPPHSKAALGTATPQSGVRYSSVAVDGVAASAAAGSDAQLSGVARTSGLTPTVKSAKVQSAQGVNDVQRVSDKAARSAPEDGTRSLSGRRLLALAVALVTVMLLGGWALRTLPEHTRATPAVEQTPEYPRGDKSIDLPDPQSQARPLKGQRQPAQDVFSNLRLGVAPELTGHDRRLPAADPKGAGSGSQQVLREFGPA
ncbi:MAG TPA: AAA family ATPase [Terriglobales bacterium]|nr:AAA family ATPase [Terriglobales bacterium]